MVDPIYIFIVERVEYIGQYTIHHVGVGWFVGLTGIQGVGCPNFRDLVDFRGLSSREKSSLTNG